MKLSLIIPFFLAFTCNAQFVEIRISNPAPRVGDEIELNFMLKENNPDSLEVVDNPWSKFLVNNMNSAGTVKVEIDGGYMTEPGALRIGPIQIPIDGKVYTTDTLTLNVSPKLPEGINNGIWVRMIRFNDVDYIVFEQRQPGEFKEETNDRGRTSHSIGTEDADWSDIHIDRIERLGIAIERTMSYTSVHFLDSGNALYKLVVYSYKPLASFKGKFTLDNSFLWKPPAGCYIEIENLPN